jgi:hypothetical protein
MSLLVNKLSLCVLLPSLFSSCASFGGRSFEIKKIKLGASDFQVEVSKYSDEVAAGKSILIMPPTGGSTFLDRRFAKKFAGAGYDVYIVENWTGLNEKSTDLELHQRLYTRAQKAISLVLNEVKSTYIGMIGTSVGALHAEVASGKQERINSIFTIVGGAPITEIIINSDQQAMKDLKIERYKRYGFKNDIEYLTALQNAFTLEPMKLGDLYKKKTYGMVVATEDETVPTETQMKLFDFWKPTYVTKYKSSHFWAIVKAGFFQADEIFKFFEDQKK